MLSLLVNTLTADGKYSQLNRDNFSEPIQVLLCQRRKTFPEFFSKLLKCGLNLNSFKRKLTLTDNVISKLRTRKEEMR